VTLLVYDDECCIYVYNICSVAVPSTGVRLSTVSVFTLAGPNIFDFTITIDDSKVTFLLGFGTHSLFLTDLLLHASSESLSFSDEITNELNNIYDYGYIDEKTLKYLPPDSPNPGRLYLLP
jgi:hypothetical protein